MCKVEHLAHVAGSLVWQLGVAAAGRKAALLAVPLRICSGALAGED